jgi:hypothetical protein
MTAEKVELSLADIKPHTPEFIKRYFKAIDDNDPIYLAVVMTDDQRVKIFFESDERQSICRIFMSAEEVSDYVEALSEGFGQNAIISFWATTPKDLLEFLINGGSKHAASKGRRLTAVSTVRVRECLVPIDVFWSNDDHFVV